MSSTNVDEPEEALALEDIGLVPEKKGKKKRDGSTLRKAPQAPKRFKSSYICFFMAKQPEIKDSLGDKATVTEISKRSAQMWRSLPPEERAHWDDVAAKDKQRYMVEKASYTGPWQVPWKRAKKDPSAPKRPMSAFLYFSQGKRRQIKEQNPDMKNTEVSRLLGEMWRNAPDEEKGPHIEKEKAEREIYKVAIADWRQENEARLEKERKTQADQAAYAANMYDPNMDPHHQPPPQSYMDPNAMNQYAGRGGPPPHMPPPGQGYAYGGPPPGYPYSYHQPVSPYQYPTNGKQPVILGPSGTPRYPPPPPPGQVNYGNGPPPPPPPPPSHHPQHNANMPPNPSHAGYGPPPPQYGYEQQHQPQHPPQHTHQHPQHAQQHPQHQHPQHPPPQQHAQQHPQHEYHPEEAGLGHHRPPY